jgi:anti-sigma B factor antagonist
MPQMLSVPPSATVPVAGLSARFVCRLTHDNSDVACIHLSGDLDLATAPRLEQIVREAERRALMIVLDLRGLAFMDSSGVHVIDDASVRARRAGRVLVVVRGRPQVDGVFALTGATRVAEFVDFDPAEPPIQALLHVAARGQAARRPSPRSRRRGGDTCSQSFSSSSWSFC